MICTVHSLPLNILTDSKITKMKSLAFVTEDVENEWDFCDVTCEISEADCVACGETFSSKVCYLCFHVDVNGFFICHAEPM